jgi:hypothetical protein
MYIHRERQRGPGDTKHTEHWKRQKIQRRTDYTERDKGHWERLRLYCIDIQPSHWQRQRTQRSLCEAEDA